MIIAFLLIGDKFKKVRVTKEIHYTVELVRNRELNGKGLCIGMT